jgi:hypothetical protein
MKFGRRWAWREAHSVEQSAPVPAKTLQPGAHFEQPPGRRRDQA